MTDFWADRIALNAEHKVSESAGEHGSSSGGSLDSTNAAMAAKIVDVTAAKEQAAPKNTAPDWSA